MRIFMSNFLNLSNYLKIKLLFFDKKNKTTGFDFQKQKTTIWMLYQILPFTCCIPNSHSNPFNFSKNVSTPTT